jgi:hypothetical protein
MHIRTNPRAHAHRTDRGEEWHFEEKAVRTVIEVLHDGERGFQSLSKEGQEPDSEGVFQEEAATRAKFANDLESALSVESHGSGNLRPNGDRADMAISWRLIGCRRRLLICPLGCIFSLLSRLQEDVIATAHLSFNLTPCPMNNTRSRSFFLN